MDELISRQTLLNKFEPWLKVKDYSDGELNMLKAILYEIRFMSATDKNVGTKVGTDLAQLGTDCISRQSAIDALRKLREEDIEDYGCEIPEGFNQDHLDRATFAIKQLPPIQPKRGRWINGHCSECNEHAPYWCMASTYHASNFCPMCGADMRGEQNDSV